MTTPPVVDSHLPIAPVRRPPVGPELLLRRRVGRAMASPLRLTVAVPEPSRGYAIAVDAVDRAWAAVTEVFERAEAAMSRFRDDSELTRLNRRDGVPSGVSGVLRRALVAADRARRVTEGRFDPRTGEPGGDGLVSVTVAGLDPAWAEIWSKALFIEGARGIAALARARGLAAWWATDDGRLEMTSAARVRTAWVATER